MEVVGALDDVITIGRLDDVAHIALVESLERRLVAVDEGGELVPAHIALLLLGAGVIGILLHGVLKAQFAGVNLVQALLRLGLGGGLVLVRCVGINLDQDVRRAAGIVVVRQVLVDVIDDLTVLGLTGGRHGVLKLLLCQVLLERVLVGVLGIAVGLKGLLKGLGTARALARVLPCLLDLLVRHRHAVFLLRLLEQNLLRVGIDELLAVLFGRQVVVDQILRPVLVLGVTVGRAHAHDLLGHGVLGEVGAVDGGRHTTSKLIARAGAFGLRHQAGARHGRDGEQHRQHADDHQDNLDGLGHIGLALLLARAGGGASLLLGRRRGLEVLFLICHVWPFASRIEQTPLCHNAAPAAHLVHGGRVNLHHFGAKGTGLAVGS